MHRLDFKKRKIKTCCNFRKWKGKDKLMWQETNRYPRETRGNKRKSKGVEMIAER